jgi:hypothetical protein
VLGTVFGLANCQAVSIPARSTPSKPRVPSARPQLPRLGPFPLTPATGNQNSRGRQPVTQCVQVQHIVEPIDRLHAAGADVWVLVLVVFGLALIWKGPQYFKVIATYFNERRRINGDLSRIALKSCRLSARPIWQPEMPSRCPRLRGSSPSNARF